MNPDNRSGHEQYWRLEPNPPVSWWKYHLGIKRFVRHQQNPSLILNQIILVAATMLNVTSFWREAKEVNKKYNDFLIKRYLLMWNAWWSIVIIVIAAILLRQ